MQKFFENVFSDIGINDIIDILIVAFLVYKLIGFIRESRAEQLVKGLLLLVLLTFLSDKLNLYTLHWILNGVLTLGVFALVVVFQPELRRGLEYVGRNKFLKGTFGKLDKEKSKHIVSEFVKAIEEFSETRTGALIIIERQTALTDVAESGTRLDAEISKELLGNIFYEGSPLHDGALLVRGDRLLAAGCVLPLTASKNLNKNLGTRHRAGIGITENSDAIAYIVSEETGVISMAEDGNLTRFMDIKNVEKNLLRLYLAVPDEEPSGVSGFVDRLRKKGEDDAEK
ncbi:MAG: diadenylate cyclase CdaA [Firmicutes bacterium]|nr:diadenylate cyclase CdaA [Bacillota bacterium]